MINLRFICQTVTAKR